MSDPQIERLARKLHLLAFFELRRRQLPWLTWAESDESKREERRALAREMIQAYATQAAREN